MFLAILHEHVASRPVVFLARSYLVQGRENNKNTFARSVNDEQRALLASVKLNNIMPIVPFVDCLFGRIAKCVIIMTRDAKVVYYLEVKYLLALQVADFDETAMKKPY